MKKLVLSMLALPLLLVACAEEKFDRSLNGTWQGKIQTQDYELLKTSGLADERALSETLIYKFDDQNLTTYRTLSYQANKNKYEEERGIYTRDNEKITYNISAHSCVEEESKLGDERPLTRPMVYKVSSDQKTLTITVGLGQQVTLKKLTEEEAEYLEHIASASTSGCFNNAGQFKASPVQKPKAKEVNAEEILEQELNQLEAEAETELNESI